MSTSMLLLSLAPYSHSMSTFPNPISWRLTFYTDRNQFFLPSTCPDSLKSSSDVVSAEDSFVAFYLLNLFIVVITTTKKIKHVVQSAILLNGRPHSLFAFSEIELKSFVPDVPSSISTGHFLTLYLASLVLICWINELFSLRKNHQPPSFKLMKTVVKWTF